MRRHAKAPEPAYIFDDRGRFSAERIRRLVHADRDVMTTIGTDFHRIDAQDTVEILRSVSQTSAVAVIGEDDEVQAGAGRGGSDGVLVACTVGSRGVDMIRAADCPALQAGIHGRGDALRAGRENRPHKNNDGDHDGRRHE